MSEDKLMSSQTNMEEFRANSEAYYNDLKDELEKDYLGKYVALNYEIPIYEIGDSLTEALTKARTKHPDKLFYVIQVGTGATFRIQSYLNSRKKSFKAKKAIAYHGIRG